MSDSSNPVNRDAVEDLMRRYRQGQLAEEEEHILFERAPYHQDVFDELADLEMIRASIADTAHRARLRKALLPENQGAPLWWHRPWMIPASATIVLLLAVGLASWLWKGGDPGDDLRPTLTPTSPRSVPTAPPTAITRTELDKLLQLKKHSGLGVQLRLGPEHLGRRVPAGHEWWAEVSVDADAQVWVVEGWRDGSRLVWSDRLEAGESIRLPLGLDGAFRADGPAGRRLLRVVALQPGTHLASILEESPSASGLIAVVGENYEVEK